MMALDAMMSMEAEKILNSLSWSGGKDGIWFSDMKTYYGTLPDGGRGKQFRIQAKIREGNPFPYYWVFVDTGRSLETVSSDRASSLEDAKRKAESIVSGYMGKSK